MVVLWRAGKRQWVRFQLADGPGVDRDKPVSQTVHLQMHAGTFRGVKAGEARLGTAATKQASPDVRAFCRTGFAHFDSEFSFFPLA
jgi:hypothetical protein